MPFKHLPSKNAFRAYAGASLVCLASAAAALPAFIATFLVLFVGTIPLQESAGDNELSLATLATASYLFVGSILILSPLIAIRYADVWIPRLLHARRATDGERSILQCIDVLAPGAQISIPEVLIVDSSAINAALLGRSRKGWTIMITSGSIALPLLEQESLIALTLASAPSGGVSAARMLIAATAPILLVSRLIHGLASPVRFIVCTVLFTAITFATGIALSGFDTNAFLFPITIFMAITIFAIPCGMGWIALLIGLQLASESLIVTPARKTADTIAVGLTRFPPPTRELIQRAAQVSTRPRRFPLGINAIWTLPTSSGPKKALRLQKRLHELNQIA